MGALTERGGKTAFSAEPLQFPGARPRNDEPGSGDRAVFQGSRVLEHERSRVPSDPAGHALDADEACLAFAARRLQELGHPGALDVTDEVFLDVDAHERRPAL